MTRACKKCNVEKPLETSYRKRTDRGEFRYVCLDCEKLSRAVHYEKNREKYLQAAKAYGELNKEHVLTYGKAWRKGIDRPRLKRTPRAKLPKHLKSDWRKNNPWAARLIRHRRRCRIAKLVDTLTASEWIALLEKYGYKCLKCGKQAPDIVLSIDHVVPIAKGGSNTIENVQPLCTRCNAKKFTKIIDYRERIDNAQKQAA